MCSCAQPHIGDVVSSDTVQHRGEAEHVLPNTNALVAIRKGKQQHPFNGPLSQITQVSRYQKGKVYLDFTGERAYGQKTFYLIYFVPTISDPVVFNWDAG